MAARNQLQMWGHSELPVDIYRNRFGRIEIGMSPFAKNCLTLKSIWISCEAFWVKEIRNYKSPTSEHIA
jgi:hypothetical protein